MIWSAALMLQHLGEHKASDAILNAIQTVLGRGRPDEVTRDMGGNANTQQLGKAIEEALVAAAGKQ